jgi:uncharacterized membrane protein YgcG
MRMLVGLFACSLFCAALAFAGCSTDNNTAGNTATTSVGAGGAGTGYHQTCNNKNPDGFCNAKGLNAEDCSCVDCATSATCTNKCVDDGACAPDSGEDCTCDDCYFKQGQGDFKCPPFSVGCNGEPEGECNDFKDCICDFCASDPRCQTCDNNGSCVPYLETCACNDCKSLEECGGSGATTSSSQAASSSSASAASSSSAGGSGGAGGAGGTSGAGGAGGAGGA